MKKILFFFSFCLMLFCYQDVNAEQYNLYHAISEKVVFDKVQSSKIQNLWCNGTQYSYETYYYNNTEYQAITKEAFLTCFSDYLIYVEKEDNGVFYLPVGTASSNLGSDVFKFAYYDNYYDESLEKTFNNYYLSFLHEAYSGKQYAFKAIKYLPDGSLYFKSMGNEEEFFTVDSTYGKVFYNTGLSDYAYDFEFEHFINVHTVKGVYDINGGLLKEGDLIFVDSEDSGDNVELILDAPNKTCFTDNDNTTCSESIIITKENELIVGENKYNLYYSPYTTSLGFAELQTMPKYVDYYYNEIPFGVPSITSLNVTFSTAFELGLTWTPVIEAYIINGNNIATCTSTFREGYGYNFLDYSCNFDYAIDYEQPFIFRFAYSENENDWPIGVSFTHYLSSYLKFSYDTDFINLGGISGSGGNSSEQIPGLGELGNTVGWLPPGPLDSLLNLPLALFNGLSEALSKTCEPVYLTLPFVNETIELPCLNSIYEQIDGLSTWWNSAGVIASAFILYRYLLSLYKWVDGTLNFRENNWPDWGGV